jgi:hypothetical protein
MHLLAIHVGAHSGENAYLILTQFAGWKRLGLVQTEKSQLKVDVCVPTRNRLPEWWHENLKRLPINKLHVATSKPLGMARMRLIKAVETPFFVMLDDDVLLAEDWFEIVWSKMTGNVGVVSGKDIYVGLGKKTDEQFKSVTLKSKERTLRFGQRGLTVNLLLHSETVKDWVPSRSDLSSWEDYDLTQHVLRKGKEWVETNAYCYHYSTTWLNAAKRGIWSGEGVKRMASEGPVHWVIQSATAVPIQLFQALSEPKLFGYHIYVAWSNLWTLLGITIARP